MLGSAELAVWSTLNWSGWVYHLGSLLGGLEDMKKLAEEEVGGN